MYWLVKNESDNPVFCINEPFLLTKIRHLYHANHNEETYVSISIKPNLHTIDSIVTCIRITDEKRRKYTPNVIYTIFQITLAEYETYLEIKMVDEIEFKTLEDTFIKYINTNLNTMQQIIIKSFKGHE